MESKIEFIKQITAFILSNDCDIKINDNDISIKKIVKEEPKIEEVKPKKIKVKKVKEEPEQLQPDEIKYKHLYDTYEAMNKDCEKLREELKAITNQLKQSMNYDINEDYERLMELEEESNEYKTVDKALDELIERKEHYLKNDMNIQRQIIINNQYYPIISVPRSYGYKSDYAFIVKESDKYYFYQLLETDNISKPEWMNQAEYKCNLTSEKNQINYDSLKRISKKKARKVYLDDDLTSLQMWD